MDTGSFQVLDLAPPHSGVRCQHLRGQRPLRCRKTLNLPQCVRFRRKSLYVIKRFLWLRPPLEARNFLTITLSLRSVVISFASYKVSAVESTLEKLKRGIKTVRIQRIIRSHPPQAARQVPETIQGLPQPKADSLALSWDNVPLQVASPKTKSRKGLYVDPAKLDLRSGSPHIVRYEPHMIPLRVTDPKNHLHQKVHWLKPSKRGIAFCGPPTITFVKFLRNLCVCYTQILRLCRSIRSRSEYNLYNKLYHSLWRFLQGNNIVNGSDNVINCLKAIGIILRFAKKEHCS